MTEYSKNDLIHWYENYLQTIDQIVEKFPKNTLFKNIEVLRDEGGLNIIRFGKNSGKLFTINYEIGKLWVKNELKAEYEPDEIGSCGYNMRSKSYIESYFFDDFFYLIQTSLPRAKKHLDHKWSVIQLVSNDYFEDGDLR